MIEVQSELTVICDDCSKGAKNAYCEKHIDDLIRDAFEDGKKQGYDEGYQEAKERASLNDE